MLTGLSSSRTVIVSATEPSRPDAVGVIMAILASPGLSTSSSTARTLTFWRWFQLSIMNRTLGVLTVTALVTELDTDIVTVPAGREAKFTQ